MSGSNRLADAANANGDRFIQVCLQTPTLQLNLDQVRELGAMIELEGKGKFGIGFGTAGMTLALADLTIRLDWESAIYLLIKDAYDADA